MRKAVQIVVLHSRWQPGLAQAVEQVIAVRNFFERNEPQPIGPPSLDVVVEAKRELGHGTFSTFCRRLTRLTIATELGVARRETTQNLCRQIRHLAECGYRVFVPPPQIVRDANAGETGVRQQRVEAHPLASHCNVDLIWVHPMAGLFESTLGYNLNKNKIPTLVVETGTCLQIDQEYCEQVFTGMVNLLEKTGALSLQSISNTKIKLPQIVHSQQVVQIHSQQSGLFIHQARLGQMIKEKELIGHVVDPVHGQILEEVAAANPGLLFTLRERPLTYAGAVLARIAQDANSIQ